MTGRCFCSVLYSPSTRRGAGNRTRTTRPPALRTTTIRRPEKNSHQSIKERFLYRSIFCWQIEGISLGTVVPCCSFQKGTAIVSHYNLSMFSMRSLSEPPLSQVRQENEKWPLCGPPFYYTLFFAISQYINLLKNTVKIDVIEHLLGDQTVLNKLRLNKPDLDFTFSIDWIVRTMYEVAYRSVINR